PRAPAEARSRPQESQTHTYGPQEGLPFCHPLACRLTSRDLPQEPTRSWLRCGKKTSPLAVVGPHPGASRPNGIPASTEDCFPYPARQGRNCRGDAQAWFTDPRGYEAWRSPASRGLVSGSLHSRAYNTRAALCSCRSACLIFRASTVAV